MTRIPRRLARVGASTDLATASLFDAYVGPSGEITVDHVRKIIALHDGVTAGGTQFTLSSGGGGGDIASPGGRLTLTSGVPVMQASVAGAVNVYYTPYTGEKVPIYNGSVMVSTEFSELSQSTSDSTKSPAAVAANKVYDLFVWNDAGTLRCTRGPAWTNNTTRGYSLGLVDGVMLNASTIANGPAAQRGTWVGTIASNDAGTIDYIFGDAAAGGVAAALHVWNVYNRVAVATRVVDTGAAYTYGSNAIRQPRGSTGNQISYVSGAADDGVMASYCSSIAAVASGGGSIGIGFNSTAYYGPRQVFIGPSGSSMYLGLSAAVAVPGTMGKNVILALEQGDGTNANTFNATLSATLSASVML